MNDKPKSNFGFDLDEILETNQGRNFKRIQPNDIRKDLDYYFEHGKPMGEPCGIDVLNSNFRWRRKGGLYVISGYEQSGKSEFCKYLAVLRAKLYKTKTVIFSPEEETEDITEDLCRSYLRKNVNPLFDRRATPDEWNRARDFINDHFLLLEFDGMADFRLLTDEYSALAEEGYKMFVTDPWNYVAEGSLDQGGIFFLKTALSHMKTFSRRYGVHKLIVEHQNNKLDHKGNLIPASKNNIQGGAMWKNKPDCIIIIHSHWTEETEDTSVSIEIAKSKQQRYNGQKGTKTLYFELETGTYHGDEPDKQFQINLNPQTDEGNKPLYPEYRKDAEPEEDQPF